jgi:hypothetical protein
MATALELGPEGWKPYLEGLKKRPEPVLSPEQIAERDSLIEKAREAYVDAAALRMQSYYTGLEKLLLMVVRRLGEAVPTGEGSHKQLLNQMARPVEGLRPAIIPEGTLSNLDELRRFRHLIRNVYVSDLEAERVGALVETVKWLHHDLTNQCLAFADFLASEGRSKSS